MRLVFLSLLLITGCVDSTTVEDDSGELSSELIEQYYQDNPEFFRFATLDDLPDGLDWQDGMHLPEIGSPDAVKGGTFYSFMSDFPRTLRWLGPDSNSHFRRYIYDETMIGLARRHPDDYELYPGLARAWAVDRGKRTVYVRLDPAARWSDGHPVTSDDFLFLFYVAQSPHIQSPWYNNVYRIWYSGITRYDDYTFSISTVANKPDMDVTVMELAPMPEHFLGALDEEFVEKFNWIFWPTTGPYVINQEDIRKGRSITLTRMKDWWGSDRKFYRYRFNPDRVRISVVRDRGKAVEMFRRGDTDLLHVDTSQDWYERFANDDPDIVNGYIHKSQFYFQHPLTLRGLYMNMTRPPFDNQDVRLGVQYATNWRLVIDKIYRGDYRRLNTANDGFGEFSHPTLKAREFNPEKARQYFSKAGYVEVGQDGVLINGAGERLSFTLTYGSEQDSDMMTVLKQEALKAGLELRLENLDLTAAWKKVQEKKHEIQYTGFSQFLELYPRYWEGQHSDTAYDKAFLEDGTVNPDRKPKPQTNNYEGYADRQVDELIETYDRSTSREEMVRIAHQLEALFYENGALVPGAVADFYRVLYWRWVKFPDGFNAKHSQAADRKWVHWIDEKVKAETLRAREEGDVFPPQIRVFDQYRLAP